MHDGAWVLLGVEVGGERNGFERVRTDVAFVEESLDAHGEGLGGRHEAVGDGEGRTPLDAGDLGAATEAAELALGEGAKDDDGIGVAGGDGGSGVANGAGAATAATAPLHVGEAELGQAEGGGEPRRVVAIVAVGGEAVDFVGVHAGVVAGGEDGREGQFEFCVRRLSVPVVGRLTDANDGDFAAHCSRHGLSLFLSVRCDRAGGADAIRRCRPRAGLAGWRRPSRGRLAGLRRRAR